MLYLYLKNITVVGRIRQRLSGLYKVLYNKYYIDEIYGAIIVRPLINGSLFLWKIIDVMLIDGIANGVAALIGYISSDVRGMQTGNMRTYVTVFLGGAIILMGYFILR